MRAAALAYGNRIKADRAFETEMLSQGLRAFRDQPASASAAHHRLGIMDLNGTVGPSPSPVAVWPVVPDFLPLSSGRQPRQGNSTGAPARRPAQAATCDPLVSLVVPVFNEEESIAVFLAATVPLLERDGVRFEIVFVNDGSRDETFARLFQRSRTDRRLRIVNLSRNFGKEAALTAGIDHARGDVLIPMDIDLQDPPELIASFVDRWREGYDIVYGIRTTRHADTAAKRLSAGWFYRSSIPCRRSASRRTSVISGWSTAAPSTCCGSCRSATAS